MKGSFVLGCVLAFFVGMMGGFATHLLDPPPLKWAVERELGYYDPITREFIGDQDKVKEFWENYHSDDAPYAPPEPVLVGSGDPEPEIAEPEEEEDEYTDWEPLFGRRFLGKDGIPGALVVQQESQIKNSLEEQGFYGIVPTPEPEVEE